MYYILLIIKTVKYHARRCRTIFPLIEVIDTNRYVQNKSNKKSILHSIRESEGIQPIGLAHLKLYIPLIESHLKALVLKNKLKSQRQESSNYLTCSPNAALPSSPR